MKKVFPVIIALAVLAVFAIALFFALRAESLPLEYRESIELMSAEYGVPPELVFAMVRNESRFDPTARSRVGAVGLMQLMPDTAQEIANKLGYAEYDLTDADTNIRFGCYYLAYLYRNTGRNWRNAVAAYNCGIGKVNAWLSDPAYSKDGELTAIPVDETRLYVEYVFRDAEKYKELLKEKSEE